MSEAMHATSTRRSLLIGAGAALAAAASTLARPLTRTRATDGDPLTAGIIVQAQTTSGIANTAGGTAWKASGYGSTAHALDGRTDAGQAVHAQATSGIALFGAATTGHALKTSGRIRFERAAGKVLFEENANEVTVHPDVELTTESLVLATPMGNADGAWWVEMDVPGNAFTIHLEAFRPPRHFKMAWLVIG